MSLFRRFLICRDCYNVYDTTNPEHVCTFGPTCDIWCGEIGCPGGHCESCTHVICTCGVDHAKCEYCGKIDCVLKHCYYCGKVDCRANHCEDCGKIDCPGNHCYNCGELDCPGGHCDHCGNIDCTCLPCEGDDWCDKCDHSNASCICSKKRLNLCAGCEYGEKCTRKYMSGDCKWCDSCDHPRIGCICKVKWNDDN